VFIIVQVSSKTDIFFADFMSVNSRFGLVNMPFFDTLQGFPVLRMSHKIPLIILHHISKLDFHYFHSKYRYNPKICQI